MFGGNRGRGRGRGRRGGRADQLCHNFQQTGRCRFGASCAYSHEPSPSSNRDGSSTTPRENPARTSEQEQARADYNTWKKLIKTAPKANDIKTIDSLWNGALRILNGDDRDWKQKLPRDLNDEAYHGREHIQTLLGMEAHGRGSSTFVDLAHPFLLVMTHSALLDCLSVDTAVGDLYNFISGSGGSRAIPFFQRLGTNLVDMYLRSSQPGSSILVETILIALSTALRELLRREQRSRFHEHLLDLVDLIDNTLVATELDAQSIAFQIVRNIVGELRGTIARAHGLLREETEPHVNGVSASVVTPAFPRDFVMPQDRHDNDRKDITEIQIPPTREEIGSNHPEFLPSTDLDQPHFLGDLAERHLDTHFRLLRHDVFGEMSQALGGLMAAVDKNPTALEDSRFSLGNVRVHATPKARISYISFDDRRGLKAQISFVQPSKIRKKLPHERRKWSEESKRLEEGNLLCFVTVHDAECSLLFFTVSEKSIDPKRDYSLSSDSHQATIKAKLGTRHETDFEVITHLSCQNTHGLLLEFPGVLLATFVLILENLQNMQRLSRLPFRQWILPDRVSSLAATTEVLDIPPPLYARASGFTFSLDAILRNAGDRMCLRSRESMNNKILVDELEERTRLD